MIGRAELARLAPTERAEMIYAEARQALGNRLWQAALGHVDPEADAPARGARMASSLDLGALLDAVAQPASPAAAVAAPPDPHDPDPLLPPAFAEPAPPAASPPGLGPNARHGPALDAAAARTGLPAAALAAIVDAEAAHRPDGSWNTHSRNPRSSAAGLTQFLSGTWTGEAERAGTWLNRVAHDRGWIDGSGRVAPAARAALLALRYEPVAAIEAAADYARRNLDRLESAGVRIGDSAREIARAAYLGHHLGAGDAVRFLSVSGLAPQRASRLLAAQIGSGEAARRIAAAPDATAAHRRWLLGFLDARVRPERFAASGG